MKIAEFLEALEDVLQTEDPCNESDSLIDYEEWDSLSQMAVMAFFDKKFGVKLTFKTIKELKTINELMALAGDQIEQ